MALTARTSTDTAHHAGGSLREAALLRNTLQSAGASRGDTATLDMDTARLLDVLVPLENGSKAGGKEMADHPDAGASLQHDSGRPALDNTLHLSATPYESRGTGLHGHTQAETATCIQAETFIALELIALARGWHWTYNILLRGQIWPRMRTMLAQVQGLGETMRNGSPEKPHLEQHLTATFRLTGIRGISLVALVQ